MVARMVILIIFLLSRGVTFVLEQPGSSQMANYPRFQQLADKLVIYVCNTFMGAYGAGSRKLTTLRSNAPWVMLLQKQLSDDDKVRVNSVGIATQYTNADGKRCATGGPKLKQTQEYHAEYGNALRHSRPKLDAGCMRSVRSPPYSTVL